MVKSSSVDDQRRGGLAVLFLACYDMFMLFLKSKQDAKSSSPNNTRHVCCKGDYATFGMTAKIDWC